MRSIWLVAVLLASSPAMAQSGARQLSADEQKVIEVAVKEELKDPDAAKFKWYPTGDSSEYCAAVNSKNGYGGYTGFEEFIVSVRRDASGNIVSTSGNIDWVQSPDDGYAFSKSDKSALVAGMHRRCLAAAGL